MASLFKDPNKLSAYRDRKLPRTLEEYDALQNSITVYVGNMSFYTTEEQVYELFSWAGEIKKIVMGLDKNSKTTCGFCFVMYYSREDAVKYITGTSLDDHPIHVDFDWGFQEGRQWGRGRSGGQDEYCTDYDPDMVDMVETMVMEALTVMAEITLVSDIEKMTVRGQTSRGESQTMYIGETQIMNPNLKKSTISRER